MKLLVTGGCGFVGSNLALKIKDKYPTYEIWVFDNLKRSGSELNLIRHKEAGIQFIHGDIRNQEDLIINIDFDYIIDAAAEPSVLAGIDEPVDYVVNTNFIGTVNTLNLATRCKAKFIFLSTSRVYPISLLEQVKYTVGNSRFEISTEQNITGVSTKGISEAFPLDEARSFYGTTKLASELMIKEFGAFSNVSYVINRCGVIAGPHQMGKVDQGVIALWMARHFWEKELNYIGFGGTGFQVRDALHIDDLFQLVDFEIHHFEEVDQKTFNVGGGLTSSVSLKEMTLICEEITGNKIKINAQVENRKGDIPIYISDNSKITNDIGWAPQKNVHDILSDVFYWIKDNEKALKPLLDI